MNREVATAVLATGSTLSGSIITVEPGRRFDAARSLVESGAFIHADVFGSGYDLMQGADAELVVALARAWPTSLDIHLMADDLERSIDALGIPDRIARVSLHIRPEQSLAALRKAATAIAEEFWISVDAHEWSDRALAEVLAQLRPDGVLEMLAPAGVPGQRSDLGKLTEASWATARAHGRLGVDGGVTSPAISALADVGVDYFVVGRALLGDDG